MTLSISHPKRGAFTASALSLSLGPREALWEEIIPHLNAFKIRDYDSHLCLKICLSWNVFVWTCVSVTSYVALKFRLSPSVCLYACPPALLSVLSVCFFVSLYVCRCLYIRQPLSCGSLPPQCHLDLLFGPIMDCSGAVAWLCLVLVSFLASCLCMVDFPSRCWKVRRYTIEQRTSAELRPPPSCFHSLCFNSGSSLSPVYRFPLYLQFCLPFYRPTFSSNCFPHALCRTSLFSCPDPSTFLPILVWPVPLALHTRGPNLSKGRG